MASGRIDIPERLVETVKSFIVSNGLVERGSLVLAAVSGGADSMAMLSILRTLSDQLDFQLAAGHFNHMLRDRTETDREHSIVEVAATTLRLPFYYGEGDVGAAASATGDSLEEAARKVRYRFLEGLAARIGAGHIATGHTRSDQAETVLMRILRGSGIRGLAGIPVRRNGGVIIRPLLELNRQETRTYCEVAGVGFADDPSNDDPRFLRNRIRLDLLPLLESSYDPMVMENLIRLSENASGLLRQIRDRTGPLIERSLTRERDGTWVVDLAAAKFVKRISDDPDPTHGKSANNSRPIDDGSAIDHTLLVVFFGDLFADKMGFDADLTRPHYEQLIRLVTNPLASGKMISLPGCTVKKEYQTLRIARLTPQRYAETAARDHRTVPAPVTIALPGRTSAPGLRITTEILDRGDVPGPALKSFDNEAYFDLQQITPPLTLRTPSTGDRMRLFGMSGTKKLSDIFIDKKIPASRRGGMSIITDSEHILWIVGVASSETTRVSDQTQKIVRISFEKT